MEDYGAFREPAPIVEMQDLDDERAPEGEFEKAEEDTPLLSVAVEGKILDGEADVVEIPEDSTEPTLGPIGARLKRNAQIQYNPYDWLGTLFAVRGRTYISSAIYVVCLIGAGLVCLSRYAVRFGIDDDRHCRAWCSRFALGTQPHSYLGFILFLLMAFRTQQAYRLYFMGLNAQYRIKVGLLRFAEALLSKTPRDAIPRAKRARMIAHAIALPYAIAADLRHERTYDAGTVDEVLDKEDLDDIVNSPSMPLYVIDCLASMVRLYGADCPPGTLRALSAAIDSLYQPYADCELVRHSPCAFTYVVHLRFLLMTYLVTVRISPQRIANPTPFLTSGPHSCLLPWSSNLDFRQSLYSGSSLTAS